jgi:hypothetical protein
VRCGGDPRALAETHLTLPIADAMGPLPLPLKSGAGNLRRAYCIDRIFALTSGPAAPSALPSAADNAALGHVVPAASS